MFEDVHRLIKIAKLLEFVGVAVIILGVVLATALRFRRSRQSKDWRSTYIGYRANFGRGILLGLELMVGADIIGTITAPLTLRASVCSR